MNREMLGDVRSAVGNRPSLGEPRQSKPSRPEASADRDGHDRYRYLIAFADELNEAVTVDRVVDVMVHWEYEGNISPPERTWHDVHEELYLVDLPVLDKIGYVDFDVEQGLVQPATPE